METIAGSCGSYACVQGAARGKLSEPLKPTPCSSQVCQGPIKPFARHGRLQGGAEGLGPQLPTPKLPAEDVKVPELERLLAEIDTLWKGTGLVALGSKCGLSVLGWP